MAGLTPEQVAKLGVDYDDYQLVYEQGNFDLTSEEFDTLSETDIARYKNELLNEKDRLEKDGKVVKHKEKNVYEQDEDEIDLDRMSDSSDGFGRAEEDVEFVAEDDIDWGRMSDPSDDFGRTEDDVEVTIEDDIDWKAWKDKMRDPSDFTENMHDLVSVSDISQRELKDAMKLTQELNLQELDRMQREGIVLSEQEQDKVRRWNENNNRDVAEQSQINSR